MASYKTTGIILARTNYAEADRILTILSRDRGKLSAIAKGVRRQGSKLGPHLEPFTIIELMLAEGKNLDIVTSARLQTSYGKVLEDYETMRRAFLCCEMVNKLTARATPPETFDLLADHLAVLATGEAPATTELSFKLKLLDELGYKPNLEECVKSREEIMAGKPYFFSAEGGGLVSAHHALPSDPKITENHIKLWRLALTQPAEKLVKITGAEEAAIESLPIANDFYDYLFGKRFKSSEI